jgi:hypothetical protein
LSRVVPLAVSRCPIPSKSSSSSSPSRSRGSVKNTRSPESSTADAPTQSAYSAPVL